MAIDSKPELPVNGSEVDHAIKQAVVNLFEHQPAIFDFTPESGPTEWNLAHHLTVELVPFFPSLDHDLDITKRSYGNRRPDIMFHKRGNHGSNYLVIEVKRDGDAGDVESDIEKIHLYWFRPPLRYRFGAVVNLRSNGKHEVRVFTNEAELI